MRSGGGGGEVGADFTDSKIRTRFLGISKGAKADFMEFEIPKNLFRILESVKSKIRFSPLS